MHECDEKGACLQVDDIEVTIPAGAISPGVTVHVEMGVALYGPFTFAENCQPVSPILWFCTQEGVEFNLPVTFKLPHIVMDDGGVRLAFAKANHLEKGSNGMFSFKEINSGSSTKFVHYRYRHYGVLTTWHHCFLCIQAEAKGRDLSAQMGYCLHIVTKQEDPFTYKIILLSLETCFNVSTD